MQNLIHPIAALIITALAHYYGHGLIGASIVSAFFAGREHAQAEYKWIEHYGWGRRANLRWWNAFDSRVWDTHSWFWNLALPVALAFGYLWAV